MCSIPERHKSGQGLDLIQVLAEPADGAARNGQEGNSLPSSSISDDVVLDPVAMDMPPGDGALFSRALRGALRLAGVDFDRLRLPGSGVVGLTLRKVFSTTTMWSGPYAAMAGSSS
mmetsp:Transcript_13119/g.29854  ORF Transcript_13119/g.29854 Transcript_13119/m.29854 type:complete len:116 (-) Transcript_13119:498-845(-)